MSANQMALIGEGPAAVLVFTPVRTFTGTPTTNTSATTRTFVTKILPAGLPGLVPGGSAMRIFVAAPASASCVITDVFIGLSSTDISKPWDFADTPIRITWNGSNTLTLPANSFSYSDNIAFYPSGAAFSIAFNLPIGSILIYPGTPSVPTPQPAGTNYIRYSKSSVNEAATVVKGTGYSAASAQSCGIEQIVVA